MKAFFERYSYESVRLALNQIAISMFGFALAMSSLKTENIDSIAICTIDFSVHSVSELKMVMNSILEIDGIDEVTHINI